MITAMDAILKCCFTFLCGAYSFRKLLHLRPQRKGLHRLLFFLCGVAISVAITYLQQFTVHRIGILSIVILSIAAFKLYYSTEISITITTTIISYMVTTLANIPAAALAVLIQCSTSWTRELPEIVYTVFVGIMKFILVVLLFRVKRLQHGLPFLSDSRYGDLGVYLSVTALIALTFVGYNQQMTIVAPLFMGALVVLGLTLFFWWRQRIQREYREQLNKRENQVLLDEITSLKETVSMLHSDNEGLSAIIHRDNKIVPAQELSVEQFLLTAAENECREERIATARKLLEQIQRVSGERQGVVTDYESGNKTIYKTNIPVIDALLLFMQHKAEKAHIAFDVKIEGNVEEVLCQAISEQDAATLLADLLENAMIAAGSAGENGRVLVEISGLDEGHFIRVSDSGLPFPQEVLDHWGIRRITTHKETGGSGIGLMTIYEICQKYHASFTIDSAEDSDLYTKSLTVRFDGKGIVKLKNELG